MNEHRTVAVLLTCYNRRDITLQCLERLYKQELPEGFLFKVFLVDDGCTDGTAEAVKAAHPDIQVIQGDGSLFWCNGMRLAWEHAAKEDPEFYLWLNDDSMLLYGGLNKLIETFSLVSSQRPDMNTAQSFSCSHWPSDLGDACIIVGSCCDPETGEHTYGGQLRLGRHPTKLAPAPPQGTPVECDTFQGNVVLVSRKVYQRIGNMRSFSHAMGDTDYGYRAAKVGFRIWVASSVIAECGKNQKDDPSLQNKLCLRERISFLKKRLPPLDWLRLLWLHAGVRTLIYWPKPYIRVLLGLGK